MLDETAYIIFTTTKIIHVKLSADNLLQDENMCIYFMVAKILSSNIKQLFLTNANINVLPQVICRRNRSITVQKSVRAGMQNHCSLFQKCLTEQ